MFRNPHDEQIPKLLLGFKFDEDFTEKMCKNCCRKVKAAYCISASPDVNESWKKSKKKPMNENNFCFLGDFIRPTGDWSLGHNGH